MRLIGNVSFMLLVACFSIYLLDMFYLFASLLLYKLSLANAPEFPDRMIIWFGGMLTAMLGMFIAGYVLLRPRKAIPNERTSPPVIFECLWWLVLPRNRDGLKHDLDEVFDGWVIKMGVKRARRRYRVEVLKSVAPLAIQFARRWFGNALEGLGKRVSGRSKVSGD